MIMVEAVEGAKAKPVIERTRGLREVGEALKRVGEGRAQGQSVIRIASF
jgi:hypothetical protein